MDGRGESRSGQARRRLGWLASEADGAFRGSRLATVAAASVLAIVLALIARPEAGPREGGGFDIESVEAVGPATITATMDTAGAPFRIDALPTLGLPPTQGVVGPDLELVVFLTAGRAPVTIRLIDPRGDVAWERVVQPRDRTQLHRRLVDRGVWRLRLETAEVRGMYVHVGASFVATRPFLERDGALRFLAWLSLAITGLIVAPLRRVGAAIAGLALLPLGILAALGVLGGWYRISVDHATLAAAVTEAAVVAVAIGSGLAGGWAWRRRGERSTVRGIGVGLAIVASLALLLSSNAALDGIGSPLTSFLGGGSEFGTALALFVFACAAALAWLGALLIGLGTAPRRVGPPAEGDALTGWRPPHRRERVTTIGSGRGVGRG